MVVEGRHHEACQNEIRDCEILMCSITSSPCNGPCKRYAPDIRDILAIAEIL